MAPVRPARLDLQSQHRDTKENNPGAIKPLLLEQVFKFNEACFLFRSLFASRFIMRPNTSRVGGPKGANLVAGELPEKCSVFRQGLTLPQKECSHPKSA
jgi:hypothetical protein